MAEHHAHSQPIQTYGPAPHNRNIWPHNSRATVFCLRFWPILLSAFQAPSYPLLIYIYICKYTRRMYTSMYVYTCIYVYNIYIYTYIHVCTYMMNRWMYIYMYICMYAFFM